MGEWLSYAFDCCKQLEPKSVVIVVLLLCLLLVLEQIKKEYECIYQAGTRLSERRQCRKSASVANDLEDDAGELLSCHSNTCTDSISDTIQSQLQQILQGEQERKAQIRTAEKEAQEALDALRQYEEQCQREAEEREAEERERERQEAGARRQREAEERRRREEAEQQRITKLRRQALNYNPFASHPVFKHTVDVGGARKPTERWMQQIEKYLIDNGGKDGKYLPVQYDVSVQRWKEVALQTLKESDPAIPDIRQAQYNDALQAATTYTFVLVRRSQELTTKCLSVRSMAEMVKKLIDNGNRTTVKAERSKITKAVRERILQRDNYTCQMCGLHVPNGAGLRVDHIIPVAAGGTSVDSNLQCLCEVCNSKKSDKT